MTKHCLNLVTSQVVDQAESETQVLLSLDEETELRLVRGTGVQSVDCVLSENHHAKLYFERKMEPGVLAGRETGLA
jgi:hypothetical protein